VGSGRALGDVARPDIRHDVLNEHYSEWHSLLDVRQGGPTEPLGGMGKRAGGSAVLHGTRDVIHGTPSDAHGVADRAKGALDDRYGDDLEAFGRGRPCRGNLERAAGRVRSSMRTRVTSLRNTGPIARYLRSSGYRLVRSRGRAVSSARRLGRSDRTNLPSEHRTDRIRRKTRSSAARLG